MRSLSYAPQSAADPLGRRPTSTWNMEYFAPQPTRPSTHPTDSADDSFKGNGILKHHVYEENNNIPNSKRSKKKQMSLTWGPQKVKARPPSGKSVKFSGATWGPTTPLSWGPASPAARAGEYATINPRKLTSRYVRPAVFR